MFDIGIFTTVKVINGNPLFFDKHQNRLLSHAKSLNITQPKYIEKQVNNFLNKNKLNHCALRITITKEGKLLIESRPLPQNSSLSLITIPDKRDKFKTFKTTNRTVNIAAKNQAEKLGADDALFIENNHIIESTCANVFSIDDNENLITPPLDGKGLQGIARLVIMEQTPVIEKEISLKTNGPLVLVNSLRINNVQKLDGRTLADSETLFKKIKSILSSL